MNKHTQQALLVDETLKEIARQSPTGVVGLVSKAKILGLTEVDSDAAMDTAVRLIQKLVDERVRNRGAAEGRKR